MSTTPIARVLSVKGSKAEVGLPAPWPTAEARATVGKYLMIEAGGQRLVGMITQVDARLEQHALLGDYKATACVDLMGEFRRDENGNDRFHRGVSDYPAIGDVAGLLDHDHLRLIYEAPRGNMIGIGHLFHDSTITAKVDVDTLLTRHFAVLGSTGVGKSSGVAIILNEVLAARKDLRIFMLDGHNEYGHCFGNEANVINPRNLKLPFWMFNFEEFVDVVYGGRPGVDEEIEILAELIPIVKSSYTNYKNAPDRLSLKKADPRSTGYTVDTPVPYVLQDLLALIDERMGKLENRSSRMHYHRLMTRLDTVRCDPRYDFMFENANVGGDTMAEILNHLFRIQVEDKPITVMQLAGLPVEIVESVVCVLCRLAFEFGLWSDGAIPLLFVCEEAHRYAAADHSVGFAPTRRALSRIAKEGRKYGVFLGLVSQRPAELDPTIISQCSTLFVMRMSNERDQALLRSAVSDATADLLDFVPSLATREVISVGEAVPLPSRIRFKALPTNSCRAAKHLRNWRPTPSTRAAFSRSRPFSKGGGMRPRDTVLRGTRPRSGRCPPRGLR